MDLQVPGETLCSQSVITSSTNQGDPGGAVSSSSIATMAHAGHLVDRTHNIAHTSPTLTSLNHSIPPRAPCGGSHNTYASHDINNFSSNYKTLQPKLACTESDADDDAGNAKSKSNDTRSRIQQEDCALQNDNANIDAIRPLGDDGAVSNQPNLLLDLGTKVQNADNTPLPSSWVHTIEGPASNKGWGIPKGMGLRGGGENSLQTGTSGWGTPPAASGAGWGGAPPAQWGANRPPGPQPGPNQTTPPGPEFNGQNKPGVPPGSSPNSASSGAPPVGAQAAQNGQPPSSGAPGPGSTSWAQAAGKGLPQGPTPTQSNPSKQIEQLNSMREALFAQDGWGGQHVNQDTSWDTPGSPEPSKGEAAAGGGSSMWKQNVNNGTDLWEANLRNGGQPPAQPQNKTPWGHTPSTNIGGTWGEEDEPSDANNVWTGAPGGPAAPSAGQGPWPGAQSGPWPDKKPEWGTSAGAAATTPTANQWGPGGPMGDPRASQDPNNRDMNLPMNDMMRMRNDSSVMRGDPRGVSGRLNNTEQMWAAHQPPPTPKLAGLPPGGNQGWTGVVPKDMGAMVNPGGKPSGWEEPSPPAQRRNIPNFDDGTSLWGQQGQTRLPQPAPGVAPNKTLPPWDKMPANMGRGNMPNMPGGMPGARMPGAAGPVKPDNVPVWGQARNGAWDHDPSGWGEDGGKLANNWPSDSPLTPPWTGGKPAIKPGWGEDVSDGSWPPSAMQRPNMSKLSSEFICSTKQFRTLCDMNYKKEDVEIALRTTNMILPEALELLSIWGRREEHPYDQSMLRGAGVNAMPPLGYSGAPGNGTNGSALNMSKMNMMGQGGQGTGNQAGLVAGQNRPGAGPSAAQLKMLIQQIQMAVQTGHLNHQILNQPLAPPTLLLVNQLLQQIKILQQLNQRYQLLSVSGQLKNNPQMANAISMQISKCKQHIQSFQSQIAGHQANYMKQQQQQQPLVQPSDPATTDLFKSPFSDPLANLPNFSDLSISDKSSMSSFQTQAQSRLNQWKLPSLDKDGEGSEFSRAPGSAKGNSSHLNETWSVSGRSDGGWPDSTTNDLSDKESQWSSQSTNSIADFIPEFEPGKPWKGTQMKSVEEDPSITPGSVARSPLTMASIKDSDLLSDSNKVSPGPQSSQDNSVLTSLGLSSSPWTSLNSVTSSVYTSPLSKPTSSKSWGESGVAASNSDLWLNSGKSAARGPPPGLGSKIGQNQPNWAAGTGSRSSWGSPWLILRNLTPQIDGSTLKTLCMQHGPLQNFHLHLNVGTALAKYSSREEASKAQQALNNCVLGNTTIFAESPGESEVATLLNQLGHANSQNSQAQSNWNIRTSQPATSKPTDTWATSSGALPGYGGSGNLWQSSGSSSSLWGSEADAHRNTPTGSSLTDFLPTALFNNETM